jgi:hypothetical protein
MTHEQKAFPDAETKRVIRDGTAPRRCWADMAFCPSSSAPAFIPPRPAPIPTAITWVKENGTGGARVVSCGVVGRVVCVCVCVELM